VQLTSGINHVAIITADLDRFITFYTEVFGAHLVFREDTPAFQHAILEVGRGGLLHPVHTGDNPNGNGSDAMFGRGHLDHLALDVPDREAFNTLRNRLIDRGATDGAVTDLGPKLSFWVVDPDGMRIEVDWVSDPTLAGFHAPLPAADYATA
jgi:catechol 2,3-dioxygenase-like lactoylglutathione lyase family enzyme